MKSQPDDSTLVHLRDKFGTGSFARLEDDPATRKYARPLAEKLAAVARKFAQQPERIARFVSALSKSTEEQNYAISRLREAGAYAVPYLIEAMNQAGISSEDRALLVHNMGRLDRDALPALLAVLDSPDSRLAADAAAAIGRIGDPRAVPFLTYPAAAQDASPALRMSVASAITRLTGHPPEGQPRTPAQELTNAAWQFHRHQVDFPGDPVVVWVWDNERKVPVSREMKRGEAEALFGERLARQALRLQPQNLEAQVALLSLELEKAIDRVGFSAFPAKDKSTFATALAAGPLVLSEVLRSAIADGKTELAAATATALGQVTDRRGLSNDGRPHPLVEALSTPGSRLQMAAARALVDMAPASPFPGSSKIVPTLARFLLTQSLPKAVVIDGNPIRGSRIAGFLKSLGYEVVLETTGDLGFRAASESADVELVLVSHDLFQGAWGLTDTLTNLRTDARTANLPVHIYGPRNLEITRPNLLQNFPGVKFMVQPVDAATVETLLGGRPVKLSDAERAGYAQEAATLLARIASQPNSPLAPDLTAAEPALATALRGPATGMAASAALGDIPNRSAQQSLADTVLDPSRPPELRLTSAVQLARSIRRFGALVSAEQEAGLAADFQAEADPEFRTALGTIVGALRAQSPTAKRTSPARGSIPTTLPPSNPKP
jgi:hypothetical protein